MCCSNQNMIRGNDDECTFANVIGESIKEIKGKIGGYHYLSLF